MKYSHPDFFNCPVAMDPRYSFLANIPTGGELSADQSQMVDWRVGESVRGAYKHEQAPHVGILPINGPLTHKGGFWGGQSYASLQAGYARLMNDDSVKVVIADAHTPGGMVHGAGPTLEFFAENQTKPFIILVNEMLASSGYHIAAAADEIVVLPEAEVGAVGAYVEFTSFAGALEQAGIEKEFIFSGAHKVDGNPYEPLTDDARAAIQAEVDQTRDMMATNISTHRSAVSFAELIATEARTYIGQDAIDAKLADSATASAPGYISDVADQFAGRVAVPTTMVAITQKGTTTMPQGTHSNSSTTVAEVPAEVAEAIAQQARQALLDEQAQAQRDADAARVAAEQAEQARKNEILGSEFAKTRPNLAKQFADDPEMPAVAAIKALKYAPSDAVVEGAEKQNAHQVMQAEMQDPMNNPGVPVGSASAQHGTLGAESKTETALAQAAEFFEAQYGGTDSAAYKNAVKDFGKALEMDAMHGTQVFKTPGASV